MHRHDFAIRLCPQEIRQAAEFLELPQLLMVLSSIQTQTREQFVNSDLNNRYKQVVRQRLEDICLEQGGCEKLANYLGELLRTQ